MNIGYVQGGTNAGRRRIKPLPEPWFCDCFEAIPVEGGAPGDKVAVKKLNLPRITRCMDCGRRRPS